MLVLGPACEGGRVRGCQQVWIVGLLIFFVCVFFFCTQHDLKPTALSTHWPQDFLPTTHPLQYR
jgi:hypothetical protein